MQRRKPVGLAKLALFVACVAMVVVAGFASSARAFDPREPGDDGLTGNSEGSAMVAGDGPATTQGQIGNPQSGLHDNGRGGNSYVNDPCMDPPPPNRAGTVQSETELATYGKYIVVGYNDSLGFYDNTQGLSGYAYSVNGGNTFIDGGGLPPVVPDHSPIGTPGSDHYAGDPVLVADQRNGTFYYSSIYYTPSGVQTLAVNSGHFATVPPTGFESRSDTRCLNDPSQQGVPDTSNLPSERIVWNKPVVAVPVTALCGPQSDVVGCDALDKEWLAINQSTGELYLTYTRFGTDGSTPIEMVKSTDGGVTWSGPYVIVPNLDDTFNQATQPVVTVNPVTGAPRITVTWIARTFANGGFGPEFDNRIESSFSDNDGVTWTPRTVVAHVNPQGEPNGYNRGRSQILNAPYINVDPNNPAVLYDTYFNGKTALQPAPGVIYTGPIAKQADILISKSTDGGATWLPPVKVNDDPGLTSHIFPSVQIDKHSNVYVAWVDFRVSSSNVFADTWAAVSKDGGATFGHNKVQTDVSTTWYVRADARPNMGDYNSSELLNGNQFVTTWADGRFRAPYCTGVESFCNAPAPGSVTRNRPATPDTMFTIAQGLGNGN